MNKSCSQVRQDVKKRKTEEEANMVSQSKIKLQEED
jgi:hypothetical protein